VATVTEADLRNLDLEEDIQRYFQAARADAYDRNPLFRLAWDAALSAFAARQIQYECYFFGDPVRLVHVGPLLCRPRRCTPGSEGAW